MHDKTNLPVTLCNSIVLNPHLSSASTAKAIKGFYMIKTKVSVKCMCKTQTKTKK